MKTEFYSSGRSGSIQRSQWNTRSQTKVLHCTSLIRNCSDHVQNMCLQIHFSRWKSGRMCCIVTRSSAVVVRLCDQQKRNGLAVTGPGGCAGPAGVTKIRRPRIYIYRAIILGFGGNPARHRKPPSFPKLRDPRVRRQLVARKNT